MSIALVLSILSLGVPVEGAVMRTWHLAKPVSSITPILPGQRPNAWTHLESLNGVPLPTRPEHVYSLIDGSIHIDRPGDWAFELSSDDGAHLWVTGTKVVDHDGLHAATARTGSKSLRVGTHPFQIKWFQAAGGADLSLKWKGPGDDGFADIPLHALRADWPAVRPTEEGNKHTVGASSRRRPGDGCPLVDAYPGWSTSPLNVSLDGRVTCLVGPRDGNVFAATDAGTLWHLDPERKTATIFASGLPAVIGMSPDGDNGLLLNTDEGTIVVRDTTGDGAADMRQAASSLLPPGPVAIVRDGALRSLAGTVLMRLPDTVEVDRVLNMVQTPALGPGTLLSGGHNTWLAQFGDQHRTTLTRLSGAPLDGAVQIDEDTLVLADEAGLHRAQWTPGKVLRIADARPMVNGIEIHLSRPVAAHVLSNPEHWTLTWIDAANGQRPVDVVSASPLLNGRGAFLELNDLPAAGTMHVRLVGPWTSLTDVKGAWSTEAWVAVSAPLPKDVGLVRSRVQPRRNTLSTRERLEGWQLLFDGHDAASSWRGFRREDLPASWTAEDGQLIYTGEGGGDIITRETWDDFDLHLEWMVQPGGNSGIFFNVAEDAGAVWATGPEMQILDNAMHSDGQNPLTSAGANYALHKAPFDSSLPPGRWNHARISVQGDHVQYWLNGLKTADYELGSPQWTARVRDSKFVNMPRYGTEVSGHIALQDHGDRVAFRNIRIKRLDAPAQP